MLTNKLHFVTLPAGQVKSNNNLSEAILDCLGQVGKILNRAINNPAINFISYPAINT